jgi:hypothetical protein
MSVDPGSRTVEPAQGRRGAAMVEIPASVSPWRWRRRLLAPILALVPVLAAGGPAMAAHVTWTPQTPISALDRFACDRAITNRMIDGRPVLFAAFRSTSPSTAVYVRRSSDAGVTWPHWVQLAASPALKSCPKVVAKGKLIVVAWAAFDPRPGTIRLRVSTNGGQTFGRERRVTTPREPGPNVSLAISRGAILVGYTDMTGTQKFPRVGRSADLGVTWTTRALDAQPTVHVERPTTKIAASGDRVFSAGFRPDGQTVAGRFSIDAGMTWQPPQVLGVSVGREFSIDTRPDRAAIVWTDGRRAPAALSPELTVRTFRDGSWQAPTTLTAMPTAVNRYGSFDGPEVVLLATARVGIAWAACQEYDADDLMPCGVVDKDDVVWTESLDGGTTWSPAEIASLGGQTVGGVSAWSGRVSAVWASATRRVLLISRFDEDRARVFVVRS